MGLVCRSSLTAGCGRGGLTTTVNWVTALRANKTAPGLVSSLSGVIAIDCGIEHSLALKSDGTRVGVGAMAMDNWEMSRRQTVRLRCR